MYCGIVLFFFYSTFFIIASSSPICEPKIFHISFRAQRSWTTSIAANGKVFFAGGGKQNRALSTVDIFDIPLNKWYTASLSTARMNIASTVLGNLVLFAGGGGSLNDEDIIDVFDLTKNNFVRPLKLRQRRQSLTATSVGSLAFFAGGSYNSIVAAGDIEIYNVENGAWHYHPLSKPRWGLVSVSLGSMAFFAGGEYFLNNQFRASPIVDIYDATTGQWSVSALSLPRTNLAVGASGTKVLFAGGRFWNNTMHKMEGYVVDRVDIYDIVMKSWSVAHLSEPREGLTAASWGPYVIFAGGDAPPPDDPEDPWGNPDDFPDGPPPPMPSPTMDIYDSRSGKWTTNLLSEPRSWLSGTAWEGKFFFGYGNSDRQLSRTVDMFSDCDP